MIASGSWGVLPGMDSLRNRAEIVAIASRSLETARSVASRWHIPNVDDSLDALLARDEVEAVVNLTPIPVHFETSAAILRAGKHLVTEKPISSTLAEADHLIELAAAQGLVIVSAPSRMLEPARVRTRQLLQEGAIGRVAFAKVRSSHAGPAWQAWPADPTWFYAEGSGPLPDMGVYGIQEITGILGPARRVWASSGRTADHRTAHGGPFDGLSIPVLVDDNVHLTLEFDDAVIAMIDCTYNVRASLAPAIEIFGHTGTVAVVGSLWEDQRVELYTVEPNGVDGTWADASGEGYEAEQAKVNALHRAILIDHLVDVLDGAEPRLTAEHARHTLEIIQGARTSAREGRRVDLTTTF